MKPVTIAACLFVVGAVSLPAVAEPCMLGGGSATTIVGKIIQENGELFLLTSPDACVQRGSEVVAKGEMKFSVAGGSYGLDPKLAGKTVSFNGSLYGPYKDRPGYFQMRRRGEIQVIE